MEQTSVAVNIKRILKEKGLVQKSVAQKAGFSEKQFCAMLNGRKLILANYLPPIAQALGTTPNDLFNVQPTPQSRT